MKCRYCHGTCIKKGFYKEVQFYKCKSCFRCQRGSYKNREYEAATDLKLMVLTREGMGIRSISRYANVPGNLHNVLTISDPDIRKAEK